MTTTNKEKLISVLLDHQREMAEMGVQRLAFFLEDLLGRSVDLVTEEALSPYIGPYIRNEAEYVPLAS